MCGEPRWACLIRDDVLSPLSSHTTAREPTGKQFVRKPTRTGGRHMESPPVGNLDATGYRSAPSVSIRHMVAMAAGDSRRYGRLFWGTPAGTTRAPRILAHRADQGAGLDIGPSQPRASSSR